MPQRSRPAAPPSPASSTLLGRALVRDTTGLAQLDAEAFAPPAARGTPVLDGGLSDHELREMQDIADSLAEFDERPDDTLVSGSNAAIEDAGDDDGREHTQMFRALDDDDGNTQLLQLDDEIDDDILAEFAAFDDIIPASSGVVSASVAAVRLETGNRSAAARAIRNSGNVSAVRHIANESPSAAEQRIRTGEASGPVVPLGETGSHAATPGRARSAPAPALDGDDLPLETPPAAATATAPAVASAPPAAAPRQRSAPVSGATGGRTKDDPGAAYRTHQGLLSTSLNPRPAAIQDVPATWTVPASLLDAGAVLGADTCRLLVQGTELGPISARDFVDMVRRGELAGGEHIALDREGVWMSIMEHPGYIRLMTEMEMERLASSGRTAEYTPVYPLPVVRQQEAWGPTAGPPGSGDASDTAPAVGPPNTGGPSNSAAPPNPNVAATATSVPPSPPGAPSPQGAAPQPAAPQPAAPQPAAPQPADRRADDRHADETVMDLPTMVPNARTIGSLIAASEQAASERSGRTASSFTPTQFTPTQITISEETLRELQAQGSMGFWDATWRILLLVGAIWFFGVMTGWLIRGL